MKHKWISYLLLFSLLLVCFPVRAEQTETLQISSAEQLLHFAEKCRLDSFSEGLTVELTADIDLSQANFVPIPIFCGNFIGNGHTISGLNLHYTGSSAGFFRYLTEEATVTDLHLSGNVFCDGSGDQVGGLAGVNRGTVQNCSFTGTVFGKDQVGGIVGINFGAIENSVFSGNATGNHFVGGIVGENIGTVVQCQNDGAINTDPEQAEMSLSDLTLGGLTGSESVLTLTDIGGISGINTGTVSQCINRGQVGYAHIGYNIGGICGTNSGYLSGCENAGLIYGRKEVGGIIGQLEPSLVVQYSTDTLQILQTQLEQLGSVTTRIGRNLTITSDKVTTEISEITQKLSDLKSQLEALDFTDPMAVARAITALQSTLQDIYDTFSSISQQVNDASETLVKDLNTVNSMIDSMKATIENSAENIGAVFTDISLEDTSADTSSKVFDCRNAGGVQGDRNSGGIVGAISFENDLDPEEDIQVSGEMSLHLSGQFRAVVRNCSNDGDITVKKQTGGGILGYGALGMIQDCVNTGHLENDGANYIGGIAGQMNGSILKCYVKCRLSGKMNVGGIAGYGNVISDCYTLCQISALEKVGNIAGNVNRVTDSIFNYYVPIGPDAGGIDGISYQSSASPISLNDFLTAEFIPDQFKIAQAIFQMPDGTQIKEQIPIGQMLSAHQIPALSSQEDAKPFWRGTEHPIYFDTEFSPIYQSYVSVLESDVKRDNGLSMLLAECIPTEGGIFTLSFSENMTPDAIESFSISQTDCTYLRYLPPAPHTPETIAIYGLNADGKWIPISHSVSGSYALFDPQDYLTFSVETQTPNPLLVPMMIGGIVIVVGVSVILVLLRKKKKFQAAEQSF